ncbi:hypothetical protein D3C84_1291160 [compost metagenome]
MSRTYCRKFSTVFGLLSGYSSSTMSPMEVLRRTLGASATGVPWAQAATGNKATAALATNRETR